MNITNSKAVNFSVKFYSFMVQLYPEFFRKVYGEPMIQVFQDRCRLTFQNKSLMGISALWARTLVDFFLTVFDQYENRGVMMTKSSWIKISGWLLTTSSLFFLTGYIASLRPKYNEYNFLSEPIDKILNRIGAPFMVIGLLLITIGLLGLISQFGNKTDKFGKTGLGIALFGGFVSSIGLLTLSIFDVSPLWEITMFGTFSLFLGLGLFGINCLRTKLFFRWNAVPLLISLPWMVLILTIFLLDSILGPTFVFPDILGTILPILSFGGIAVVGYMVFSDKVTIEPTPA